MTQPATESAVISTLISTLVVQAAGTPGPGVPMIEPLVSNSDDDVVIMGVGESSGT